MTASNPKAKLIARVEAGLNGLGFSKSRGLCQMTLAEGVIARVGLNVRPFHDGTLQVLVIVGVRFDEIYERGIELGVYPLSDGNLSLSSSLRYLVPPDVDSSYETIAPGDEERLAGKIVDHIRLYGMPAVDSLRSRERAIREATTSPRVVWQGVEQFLPLAYLLQGMPTEALASAEVFSARLGTRGEGKRYIEFLGRLRKTLAS